MHTHRSGTLALLLTALLVVGSLCLLCPPAQAIAPRFVPDRELAEKPILVVAHWSRKAKVKPHSQVKGNLLTQWEVQTELIVERVIKGDLQPGKHRLLYGMGVGWQKDGKWLGSYTSTEVLGDVEDVTRPNLWFLSRKRSWDKKDSTLYFSLDTYRGVQPIALERYFAILMQSGREEKIASLLESPDSTVVLRTLEYIGGGRSPWPYQEYLDDFIRSDDDKHPPLVQHAAAVERLLQLKEPQIRRMAAAVYAFLAKEESKTRMRQLLTDNDPSLRATAIGTLTQYRDAESAEAFPSAVVGLRDTYLGCAVIRRMAEWKDLRLVPALIAFLQTDASEGNSDDEIPAVQARKVLRQITGYLFPYDVAASQKAWTEVQSLSEPKQRLQHLMKRLGAVTETDPLQSRVVNDQRRTEVKIRNRSQHPVDLARSPEDVSLRTPNFLGGGSKGGSVTGRKSFLRLLPGKSVRVPVQFSQMFLNMPPKTRKVELLYIRNGNEYGLHAWIGTLNATFGPGWKEPRRVFRPVFQRWPNGKVKMRGQRLNGEPYGVWTYYRKDGKRVRDVDHTTGTETIYNLAYHP